MSEMSDKWDKQWSLLLTHCHGESVQAKPDFKASLLDQLKLKAVENAENDAVEDQADDEKWSRLMKAAYVPCHVDTEFKPFLLEKLKRQQKEVVAEEAEARAADNANDSEEKVLRTILTRSYQPVAPRKAFETRLLENLKDRQRNTVILHKKSRRRTMFLSTASGLAAAAMVMFVVWAGPLAPAKASATHSLISSDASSPAVSTEIADASAAHKGDLRLTVPNSAVSAVSFDSATGSRPLPGIFPVAGYANQSSNVMPASLEMVPASFANYRAAEAFNGPALPDKAYALQNIEVNIGNGWFAPGDADRVIALSAGLAFRSRSGMGHLRLSDGSLITVSPNALMTTSEEGLTVERGLALVSAPEHTRAGFRLHFPERDIVLEPGTDLAVMVESSEGYAEGGAPAPMVMIVDRHDSSGGMALARGPQGIGPLLAKQLYRIDRYVTPDLPSRALCDTECQDLDKFFRMETVRQVEHPMASFAGGFAGDRDMGVTSMVLTPAGYSKRGGKWVSQTYSGQQTIKIRYLSDEYFGFANERRDLARDLALGGEIVIDGGDGKFYEIVK